MEQINFGELWKIGPHIVLCGDLEKPEYIKELLERALPIDMIYTDPPWNAGLCRYFRTIANQSDKSIKTHSCSWEGFIKQLGEVFEEINPRTVYLECSKSNYTQVKDYLSQYLKIPFQHHYELQYGTPKRPYILLNWSENGEKNSTNVGLSGYNVVKWCFNQPDTQQCKVILDPCTGLGYTAKACIEHDKLFYGMELNPARLTRTIEMMSKLTNEKPELIDRI